MSAMLGFVDTGKVPKKQKGANLTHPDRGTAKRLYQEHARPRRWARALGGLGIENSRFSV